MEAFGKIAEQYGLFVALVVYVIWDSRQREGRYISIIDQLTLKYDDIKRDVEEILRKL